MCIQLTVFLSFYAQLDVIIIFSPIRPIVHLFTLDIGLQRGHGITNQNTVSILKYFKIIFEEREPHTTILPLNNLGMVPSTHVPFILFSTLSSNWKRKFRL